MAKRSAAKKNQAGSASEHAVAADEKLSAQEQPKSGRTLFDKVVLAFVLAGCLYAAYTVIDNTTAWGDTEKLIKRKMSEAEKHSIFKRYDKAIEGYERIIERWSKDDKYKDEVKQARLNLAKALKDSERFVEAITMYNKLAEEYAAQNRDMYAWLLLETGDCYNSILNKADAIRIYTRVIDEFKDTDWAAEALFGIAEAHKRAKDYAAAVKYYDQIAEKYKKGFLSAEALTNKAMILEEQGMTA
ncbi:MAG TPA: tetratricopeptide repeat protein, partial [Candidatus Goldiibacteriota bacterium]|nr:tetratricopeptide repeat protein [Candidatus Goldiibacteriota bacterium]